MWCGVVGIWMFFMFSGVSVLMMVLISVGGELIVLVLL